MMAAQSVENILKQADHLTLAERLWLATRLIEGVRREMPFKAQKQLKWRDVRGMAKSPLFGEDAQAYISRTRREDTEHREHALKREQS